MTTTLRPARRHSGNWTGVGWVLAVVAALAAVGLVGARFIEPPPTVDAVRITNPADFDVQLFLTTDTDDLSLRLPTIPAGEERPIEEVLDRGGRWTFHARSGGGEIVPWSVSRDEFAADGWRLTIPDDVIDQLREAGAVPSPP